MSIGLQLQKIGLRWGITGFVLGGLYPLVSSAMPSQTLLWLPLGIVSFPSIIVSLLITTKIGISPLSCIGEGCPPFDERIFNIASAFLIALFNFPIFYVIGALIGWILQKARPVPSDTQSPIP
ncbi:MAG: hypothetical protein WCS85_05470 [Candidatus Peribacteraceae bacterium]